MQNDSDAHGGNAQTVEELIGREIEGLSANDALAHIGALIDAALDEQSIPGTDRAFVLLDSLTEGSLSPDDAALSHYFRANAWDNRRREKTDHDVWAWEQPEVGEQILELRRSIRHEGFEQLSSMRQCQILTNLANQLDSIGRFVEAIALWDRVLLIHENFGKALGNRGVSLKYYAHSLYDPGHSRVMLVAAFDSLTAATSAESIYENVDQEAVRSSYVDSRSELTERVDTGAVRARFDLHDHSLGDSPQEQSYRAWCLREQLFINPLNDLGAIPIAARDVLTLPNITASGVSAQMPPIIGFYNQLKQEFVSARYFFFEGQNSEVPHFSDRGVLLHNTLDYPSYSLATERMRAAFRIAYSVFDKIGYFINAYFQIGRSPSRVNFRNVWFRARSTPPRLLERFESCQNWPLRGLFWLSKDLFDEQFQLVMEPDAEARAEIRNCLEHKYLHLREGSGGIFSPLDASDEYTDLLVYGLAKSDFATKTLSLLKLVRAALIYLSLAVHREERTRAAASGDRLTLPMFLDRWEDDWKC